MQATYGETGPIDSFDFHGRTDPAIVRGLLRASGWSDPDIEAGFGATWDAYYEALERELVGRDGCVTTYPGVVTLLDAIAADDRFACGLVTGNMEEGARRKLMAAGLAGRFGFGAYGSDSERREELPPIASERAERLYGRPFDLRTAVVVGDTPEDVRCGRSNGTRVLAVATGRHSVDDLQECGADAVFGTLGDTNRVMRVLIDE
jgi:phosphoglycolate phosphatase-like HAD superfamily hydrolase